MNKPARTEDRFDNEYDVVVGYGYAGGISAMEAAKNGAKVLLIEQASVPGGVSICSYGALRCASDRQLAFDYLKATNAGRKPDDVIRALADGMCEIEDYVRELAKVSDAEVGTTEEYGMGANYPLPGTNTFYHSTISLPGFDARKVFPWANGAPGGPVTFKLVADNLARHDVDIWLNTEALRLISRDTGSTQEILGVTVRNKARGTLRIMARCGVILCAGGFEGNREMREQFWEGGPVHKARQEIIDAFGDPIPRLFAAGEMGSSFGHLYMSGSNITECFVNGRIAGRNVMDSAPWKETESGMGTKTHSDKREAQTAGG